MTEIDPNQIPAPDAAAGPSLGGACLVRFDGPSTSSPVPIVGVGESGLMFTDPDFLREMPPAYYWVWGQEGSPLPGDGRWGPVGLTPPSGETAAEHERALWYFVEQFQCHLFIPFIIVIGELEGDRGKAQAAWLETVAREANCKLVWMPPNDEPPMEPPVNAIVFQGFPGLKQRALLLGDPWFQPRPRYFPSTLAALLRSDMQPSLMGVTEWDLAHVFSGREARLFRGEARGPERARQAMQEAIQQIREWHWEPETITSAFIQLNGPWDLGISEAEIAREIWQSFVGEDRDGSFVLTGMPLHANGRRRLGWVFVDLIVCRK